MSHTVLDSMALGYQPVWNPGRQLAAVRLQVLSVHPEAVNARHLLEALGDDWPAAAPTLILSIGSAQLRRQALACEPAENLWLEWPADDFEQPDTQALLATAA